MIPVGLFAICLAGFSIALPQQPQPATSSLFPAPYRAPAIDPPPEPLKGEGVDFTLKIIDATTGGALAGVTFQLQRIPPQRVPQTEPPDWRRWAYMKTTDGKGEATISTVVAANYTISPKLSGYVPAKGSTDSIQLVAGTKSNPRTIRMWKAVAVEGTVVDPDKNPLPDVSVEPNRELERRISHDGSGSACRADGSVR